MVIVIITVFLVHLPLEQLKRLQLPSDSFQLVQRILRGMELCIHRESFAIPTDASYSSELAILYLSWSPLLL